MRALVDTNILVSALIAPATSARAACARSRCVDKAVVDEREHFMQCPECCATLRDTALDARSTPL